MRPLPGEVSPAYQLGLPGALAEVEGARVLSASAGIEALGFGVPVVADPASEAPRAVKLATEPGPIIGLTIRPQRVGVGSMVEPGQAVSVLTGGALLVLAAETLGPDDPLRFDPTTGWWSTRAQPGRLLLTGPWLIERGVQPWDPPGTCALLRLNGPGIALA